MDRSIRVLLAAAAAANLRVAWLMYTGLADGSICDYPADCFEWWFPKVYGQIQPVWLASLGTLLLAAALARRARWPWRDLALLGAAAAASFLLVAITPVLRGARVMTRYETVSDSHLWLWDGFAWLALVATVVALVLASLALRGPRQADVDPERAASGWLWLPPAATAPIAVVASSWAAQEGRWAGAGPDVARLLVLIPFAPLVVAQVSCAVDGGRAAGSRFKRPLLGATVAAALVLVLHLVIAGVWVWRGAPWTAEALRSLIVAATLLLPLAAAWWCHRSATRLPRVHDSTGQELENTAGPPS